MSIKTNAMIAHNGADGYTLHVDYDPDTDDVVLKAIYNDGTEKNSAIILGNETVVADSIINKSIVNLITHASSFGSYALRGCGSLATLSASNAIALRSFSLYGCTALRETYFPAVTLIQGSTFTNCSSLESISFPSIVTIESKPFEGCTNLSEIYIGKNAATLSATAFSGTADGVVINCGFSATDPAAANAPWGATNATVNYDVAEPNPPVLSALSTTPNPGLIQTIDFEPIEEIQPVEPEPVVEVKKTKTKRSAK